MSRVLSRASNVANKSHHRPWGSSIALQPEVTGSGLRTGVEPGTRPMGKWPAGDAPHPGTTAYGGRWGGGRRPDREPITVQD